MSEVIAKVFRKIPAEAERIRRDVFMTEQGYANEFDEIDARSEHIVLYADGEAVATCRVFRENGDFVLGRLSTVGNLRGCGLGTRLLREAEGIVRRSGGRRVKLSARLKARGFYEKNGYIAVGEIYHDEGQPHIEMRKELHDGDVK